MPEKDHLEQNKHEEPTPYLSRVMVTGFFGGLFWSFIGYLASLFKFTEHSPSIILEPWTIGEWKNEGLGDLISILILSLISILVALLYNAILKNFNNVWTGIFFGLGLWAIVYFILNPIFPSLSNVTELELNTIVTSICLYILYGVFIGYSISFDYNEIRQHQLNYSKE